MENRRFVLLALIGVIVFFMYQAWQKDYARPEAPAAAEHAPTAATAALADAAPVPAPVEASKPAATPDAPGPRIRVETDLYIAEISLQGGELRRLQLKGYPVSREQPQDVALLDDGKAHRLILQSGLAGSEQAFASHETLYSSAQPAYALAPGADALEVPLEYATGGYRLRKLYRFKRGSYEAGLVQALHNATAQELTAAAYVRLVSDGRPSVEPPPFTQTFVGLGVYERKNGGDKYRFRKIAFEDLAEEPLDLRQQGGWLAALQHYFVAVIIPPAGETLQFAGKPSAQGGFLGQYVGPLVDVAAGTEHRYTTRLYLGPNLQGTLNDIAPGLELTQDYGILTPICEPLFWLLAKLRDWVKNWGVAIILLTIAVKALMWKLSEAQYRSMHKMKKFAPRIQDIKERYGQDRERLNKAMMDLYKKEGFNPLAGCWPLLVQFPVFIALFWVLSQSVELRQADFALWIQDLAAPDPYYVLPLLFGATMFLQQKLSGQQMADPMQQRIMNLMPIFMTAFFAFFASGLVLYWFVSNLIGIAQQWYITRKLTREEAAALAKR